MHQERRRNRRSPAFFILEQVAWEHAGQIQECRCVVKNITPDGMLMETEAPIAKHDLLQIPLTLPGSSRTLLLEAKVRWAEPGPAWKTLGIEFLDLSEEQREIIMEYLTYRESFRQTSEDGA
jgi:hypothetical protein